MNLTAIQAEQKRISHIINQMEQKRERIESDITNHTLTSEKVILFTEDSGSGYHFIKSFIKICYPLETLDIIPLNGHGNIKYIPDYLKNTLHNYDNNRKAIPKIVKHVKKEYPDIKIYLFSPLCFESILLSFRLLITDFLAKYNIPENQYTKLHYELIGLLDNKITSINWLSYITPGISIENIIEQALEEITKNTKYQVTHNPSNISDCWIKNCSIECQKADNYCNMLNLADYDLINPHKIELIATNSALGGLTYIMDKIYGNTHHRVYPTAIANDSPYKAMLVQET